MRAAMQAKHAYAPNNGCSSSGLQTTPSRASTSTLPEETPINELVSAAHQRWRIERDYQDLKQDFGLGHYEGRGWRGFHHHAALSIAAYGFLMAERLVTDKSVGGKKNFITRQVPALPEDYIPRGSPARAAARGNLDHDTAPAPQLSADRSARAVPLLRQGKRKVTLVTSKTRQRSAALLRSIRVHVGADLLKHLVRCPRGR